MILQVKSQVFRFETYSRCRFLAPVDAFPAQNRWGIHGVIGNVWEWTSTWYTARHSPLPKTNDTGPPKGTDRVKKGGSFLCTTQYCYRNDFEFLSGKFYRQFWS